MLSAWRERHALRDAALSARLASVLTALQLPAPHPDAEDTLDARVRRLAPQLRSDRPDVLWLVLATITGTLPMPDEVTAAARACDFDGPDATLVAIMATARPSGNPLHPEWVPVRIAVGEILIDLHHTSQTLLATGIQRVARQAARRWHDEHDVLLVGWSRRFAHLRPLSAAQAGVALYGDAGAPAESTHAPAEPTAGGYDPRTPAEPTAGGVLIPWHSTYVLPELMTERDRALRLQALVRFAHCRSAAIGFDCVPLTSADTIADGMGAGFSVNLTAIARMDLVICISEASATEYRGWRAMLAGAGLAGPEIVAVDLAVQASAATPAAIAAVRSELMIGTLPMVLVVGSHEPRKNHLAVLHAAERLWREGHRFSLTFIGGNSWNSQRFTSRLAQLRSVGRPVQTVSALSEEMLWAAYEVAHFTVFPSLNEGFGLPVAESLATGTPVITAGFGSMREIAVNGGALLIDPGSDTEITDAMRTLLSDPAVHARLSADAAMVTIKTWDTYAFEVWRHLVASEDRPAALSAALQNGNL